MKPFEVAASLLTESFGFGAEPEFVSVPGRVNLIGEHIDYHGLPVLPMAIQRRITVAYRPRRDNLIRAVSQQYGLRQFDWVSPLFPDAPGDWVNYVKSAAYAVAERWEAGTGIDAAVVSDLPPAAGLSSSSALLTAFALALARSNQFPAAFDQLMEILPNGEYFVGTRGGGMDHAAVLGAKAGCALLVRFAPVICAAVPIPRDWGFIVANSLVPAEKSGAVRLEFNARRSAGLRALQELGFSSYGEAVARWGFEDLCGLAAGRLADDERRAFLHVAGEAARVAKAVSALARAEVETFGCALYESHESLRDLLRVSHPELDQLVQAARDAGALGARLTGAGFGGCVVVFSKMIERDRIAAELRRRFYAARPQAVLSRDIIMAEPSNGALFG